MQFVLNFMRVSKIKSWKYWKWVVFTYNLEQKLIIFFLIIWDGGSMLLWTSPNPHAHHAREILIGTNSNMIY
jgi:hypothetical protein